MQLIIDSANLNDIRELVEYYPIDGVTTNPSIIVKEKKNFLLLLEEIREVIGCNRELFIQTLAVNAEEIVKEANYIRENILDKLVIKVPATKEGIKAIKALSESGVRTMATAIYTPLQGYLAAKAGATYVTPYVNRIENLDGNAVNVVKEIVEIIEKHHFNSKVLAASFKSVQQVHDVCLIGAHGVTVPPDILRLFLSHRATEANVKVFIEEWQTAYGEKSIIDANKIKI
ncbi:MULTISPECIES: transaldolase family protein [Neobacillus]|uniref:Fructose-6-phosphate aldolase n=1 Tax=Neobacillus rhizophilus TaxID=2833579 RepID=A0A942YZJ9_9BACI|nr:MULTISPECIES: transaldolase family protein [Neobacillus]MBS4216196.1 fructose-6-phosphate aldolase [Neobacillus rhizophilus]MBU8917243.1 fructose-6-phosphate aldolase [Bacillus sp. FJAT-29953]